MRLDEHGPRGRPNHGNGGGERARHALGVAAIQPQPFDAVPAARCQSSTLPDIAQPPRGVGILVVFDDEHDRQRPQCGEIERLVHVAVLDAPSR